MPLKMKKKYKSYNILFSAVWIFFFDKNRLTSLICSSVRSFLEDSSVACLFLFSLSSFSLSESRSLVNTRSSLSSSASSLSATFSLSCLCLFFISSLILSCYDKPIITVSMAVNRAFNIEFVYFSKNKNVRSIITLYNQAQSQIEWHQFLGKVLKSVKEICTCSF